MSVPQATARVSTSKAHAASEGTLTAPSFIGISGSSSLIQSSAALQVDLTHGTTISKFPVAPSIVSSDVNSGFNQAFILGP